jgi:hypothetical protein
MSHNIAMPRKKSDRIVLKNQILGLTRPYLQCWNQAAGIRVVADPHALFGVTEKDTK